MPVIPALEFKVILSYMDNLRTLWHIWDPSVHHPHLTPKKSISDIEIICTHTTKMFFPFWAQATPVSLPYGWYPTELKLHTPQISCAFKILTLCEQPLINSGSMDCVFYFLQNLFPNPTVFLLFLDLITSCLSPHEQALLHGLWDTW